MGNKTTTTHFRILELLAGDHASVAEAYRIVSEFATEHRADKALKVLKVNSNEFWLDDVNEFKEKTVTLIGDPFLSTLCDIADRTARWVALTVDVQKLGKFLQNMNK